MVDQQGFVGRIFRNPLRRLEVEDFENMANTTKRHVKKLVTRLCQLPGQDNRMFDDDMPQVIRDDLGRVLERLAKSDEHATEIVDRLLLNAKFRPTPADISETCRLLSQSKEVLPAGCAECVGADYVIVEVEGNTAAKRCRCDRGRRLLEIDKARKEKAAREIQERNL